jgi:hypothetical protein
MKTMEEMQAHYKAVRERLRYTPPSKPIIIPPIEAAAPEPEPAPAPAPAPKIQIVSIAPLPPAQSILHEIALKHDVTVKDITGRDRKKKYMKARQEAAYELKLRLNLSFPRIGRVLGKRDHTTILHSVRKHAELNNLPPLSFPKEVQAHSDYTKKESQNEHLEPSL